MDSETFITDLEKETREIVVQANAKFGDLSIRQLAWKPDEQSWCINQVLEHVNLLGQYYLPIITLKVREAVDSGQKATKTYKPGFIGGRLTKSMELDEHQNVKSKFKTGKGYDPSIDQIMNNEVFKEFIQQQEKTLQLLGESRKVNLMRIKIPAVFFKLLRLRLGDCLHFIVVHNKRHLVQAEKLIKLDGFPSSS